MLEIFVSQQMRLILKLKLKPSSSTSWEIYVTSETLRQSLVCNRLSSERVYLAMVSPGTVATILRPHMIHRNQAQMIREWGSGMHQSIWQHFQITWKELKVKSEWLLSKLYHNWMSHWRFLCWCHQLSVDNSEDGEHNDEQEEFSADQFVQWALTTKVPCQLVCNISTLTSPSCFLPLFWKFYRYVLNISQINDVMPFVVNLSS